MTIFVSNLSRGWAAEIDWVDEKPMSLRVFHRNLTAEVAGGIPPDVMRDALEVMYGSRALGPVNEFRRIGKEGARNLPDHNVNLDEHFLALMEVVTDLEERGCENPAMFLKRGLARGQASAERWITAARKRVAVIEWEQAQEAQAQYEAAA